MTGERVSEALLSYANKMCSILAGAEESGAQEWIVDIGSLTEK